MAFDLSPKITIKAARKTTGALPDKLSELILVALSDLEKCEDSHRYEIDMNFWHDPDGEVCRVCFAGVVMAQTKNASVYQQLGPSSFGDDYDRLRSLNYVRCGEVDRAVNIFHGKLMYTYFGDMPVTSYYQSPDRFKHDMRRIAGMLKQEDY